MRYTLSEAGHATHLRLQRRVVAADKLAAIRRRGIGLFKVQLIRIRFAMQDILERTC